MELKLFRNKINGKIHYRHCSKLFFMLKSKKYFFQKFREQIVEHKFHNALQIIKIEGTGICHLLFQKLILLFPKVIINIPDVYIYCSGMDHLA